MMFTADCPIKENLKIHLMSHHCTPSISTLRTFRGSRGVGSRININNIVSGLNSGRYNVGGSPSSVIAWPSPMDLLGAYTVYANIGVSAETFSTGIFDYYNSQSISIVGVAPPRLSGPSNVFIYDTGSGKRIGRTFSLSTSTGPLSTLSVVVTSSYQISIFLNGLLLASAPSNFTPIAYSSGSGNFRLLLSGNGWIFYELLIYSGAHDDATRQKVEAYLRTKREGRL